MKIAVAGGTGRVGRHVVEVLTERGHEVVAMSRATGVNVFTGTGLAEALSGVECIIDAVGGVPEGMDDAAAQDKEAAAVFFTTAARNMQQAGERAGVRLAAVVSIIGIDKVTTGHPAAKVDHERAWLAGPIPVRILRSDIFHELVSPDDGLGSPGRRGLRAEDADPAHRRSNGRRRAGRSGRGRR